MKTNEEVTKYIHIKVPYAYIWTFAGIMIFFGSTVSLWSGMVSDRIFWVIFGIYMLLAVCILYLFYKFYNRKALKEIVVREDGDVILVYQIFRHRFPDNREHKARSQSVSVITQGNVMNVLENRKSIARIYKNTLKDKNDWEWMINYFN